VRACFGQTFTETRILSFIVGLVDGHFHHICKMVPGSGSTRHCLTIDKILLVPEELRVVSKSLDTILNDISFTSRSFLLLSWDVKRSQLEIRKPRECRTELVNHWVPLSYLSLSFFLPISYSCADRKNPTSTKPFSVKYFDATGTWFISGLSMFARKNCWYMLGISCFIHRI